MSDPLKMAPGHFRFSHRDGIDQFARVLRRGIEKAKAAVASSRGGQRSAPRERDDLAERLAANGVLR